MGVVGAGLGLPGVGEEERGEEEEGGPRPLPVSRRRLPAFCAFAQSNVPEVLEQFGQVREALALVSIDASPGAASATAATCGATLSTGGGRAPQALEP